MGLRSPLACSAAALLLVACSGEAELLLELETLASEAPLTDATLLEVALFTPAHEEIAVVHAAYDGAAFSFPALPVPDEPFVLVELFAYGSSFTDVVARGVTRARLEPAFERCCLEVCVCSSPVFAAGGCDCGSTGCSSSCE